MQLGSFFLVPPPIPSDYNRSMLASIALLLMFGQTAPNRAFKANTEIGQFTKIGMTIMQGGKPQDWGNQQKIALNAARVDLNYPCKDRLIAAEAGLKLLVLNLTQLNTSRNSLVVGGDTMPLLQIWDPHGSRDFRLVNYFDPKTKTQPTGILKTGQKVTFDMVVQVPANFDDFRLGLSWQRPEFVAWLDLRGKMGKMTSVFSPNGISAEDVGEAQANTPFDLGPLKVTVIGEAAESDRKGSVASFGPGRVLSLTAENVQAAPVRWGWQYIEATLVLTDGTKVSAYPSIYVSESGNAWVGDLEPGKSVRSQFVFSTASTEKPKWLELKWIETRRSVRVKLD